MRYPGSKAKIRDPIRRRIHRVIAPGFFSGQITCYCEPFFGSGAIGWGLLSDKAKLFKPWTRVLINDVDVGIANLWKSVRDVPEELTDMIERFEPSVERFRQFKAEDGRTGLDPVRSGFQKLALHQLSFSGLGVMAGSPLGGWKQSSEYNVNCRWIKTRLTSDVMRCHKIMRRFTRLPEITSDDFRITLRKVPCSGYAYLDPPYYVKGVMLYKHSFSERDHEDLSRCLQVAEYKWALSYDDHPFIRSLYSWARVDSFNRTPTVGTSNIKRRKNSELIITNYG